MFGAGLLDRLPVNQVRGKCVADATLADQTWFRVGGPAEVLFRPADEEDLAFFLAHCPADIPVTVIGIASNLLIRDGGIPGVVVKLGPAFGTIRVEGEEIRAGAAAIDLNVARAAQNAGIAGLEFLCGIPGTIGGGLRMNAGSYGREFKDAVVRADVVTRNGTRKTLHPKQIGFSYRHTDTPEDTIFVSALLQGDVGEPHDILKRMEDIQKARNESQPIRERTGGSTFANPDNDPQHRKSWQLIEAAGCRGMKMGRAKVSEKHCNFLINTGGATATEIEALGEEVRRRVRETSGVELRWEIKRIGISG
ncbi:MAG: UDP-N-acetylmuramate dehydrogenase [Alphaproteobacteria bacterium]|nr:UDP-N-acetylmuramate dehydrogenase [Alphaproteobacteria bacterium]